MEIEKLRQYLVDYDGFKPVTDMSDGNLGYLYDAISGFYCEQLDQQRKSYQLLQIHSEFNCDVLLHALKDLDSDQIGEIHAAITARLSNE